VEDLDPQEMMRRMAGMQKDEVPFDLPRPCGFTSRPLSAVELQAGG
jgi:hypothetical protein